MEDKHNTQGDEENTTLCDSANMKMMAMLMVHPHGAFNKESLHSLQQCHQRKGVAKFGDKAEKAFSCKKMLFTNSG